MKPYDGGISRRTGEIAKSFLGYEGKYVPREQNEAADLLSKLGLGRK